MRLFHQNNLGVIPDRHIGPADPELAFDGKHEWNRSRAMLPRSRHDRLPRTPASILCVEQKTLSTFSDICAPEPERKHRIACRLQCRLRKGTRAPTNATRKPSTNKFGGYIAENHKLAPDHGNL
jgi:hypothetical protein